MVANAGADYSSGVTDGKAAAQFHVSRASGPAGHVVLRGDAGDRQRLLVFAGYQGPELPAQLTDPVVLADGPADAWLLRSAEGTFAFRACAVDRLEERPSLYAPLHRPFALTAGDRVAVRILLWLLRLPGGASLLRRWHSRRA